MIYSTILYVRSYLQTMEYKKKQLNVRLWYLFQPLKDTFDHLLLFCKTSVTSVSLHVCAFCFFVFGPTGSLM